jgi:hypothetical protein
VKKKDKSTNKEPDWLDPANDRKTPYTDEEIEILVDGFIRGLDDQEWLSMKAELGEKQAREKIRSAFVRMDENRPKPFITKGTVH